MKQFLQKWLINNLLYKVLAIVFAFVLWLAIMNIQDATTTKRITDIPVTIINEDKVTDDNVYTIKSGSTATISVSGRRSIVDTLTASDFTATADFEQLSITNAVPITISMTGANARYQSSLTINQTTNMMVINIETIESRTMSVQISYGGDPGDKIIDSAQVEPSFIKITAPATILESLSSATALLYYRDIEDSGTFTVAPTLYDASGNLVDAGNDIELDCEELDVTLEVSRKKTVPLAITPRGTPAEGYELTEVVMSSDEVTLKGDRETILAISRLALPSGLLDLNGQTRSYSITVDLKDYAPAGTEVIDDDTKVTIMVIITEIETEATAETDEAETASS